MEKLKAFAFKYFYPYFNSIIRMLFGKDLSKKTFGQIVKHYAAGFFGSILNYAIFVILKNSGLGTKLSNTITYFVIIVVMFVTQKFFIYKPDNHSLKQPFLFIMSGFIMYVMETFMLLTMIDGMAFPAKWCKLFSIITLSPLSFIMQKYIVFKNRNKDS